MNVLIIGASGLVGYNCYKYFTAHSDWKVVGTHRNFPTLFTTKWDACKLGAEEQDLLNKLQPNVIIHCGALTNVDECEVNPEKSYFQTVVSTQNVIEIAKKYNSKIVYISTDYVFDGEKGPYKETDMPNPINIYGKHKLLSEHLVGEHSEKHLILRVTNVYGEEIRGKNFVARLLSEPAEKTLLRLPIDQFATPIHALDIAKVAFYLLKDDKKGLYHLASADYYNRVQLANKILDTKKTTRWVVETVTTEALKQSAKRPLNGGLSNAKILAEYPYLVLNDINDYLSRHSKDE
jgi:dTDP-4-dehydrorhamnose reductase